MTIVWWFDNYFAKFHVWQTTVKYNFKLNWSFSCIDAINFCHQHDVGHVSADNSITCNNRGLHLNLIKLHSINSWPQVACNSNNTREVMRYLEKTNKYPIIRDLTLSYQVSMTFFIWIQTEQESPTLRSYTTYCILLNGWQNEWQNDKNTGDTGKALKVVSLWSNHAG